MYTDLTSLSSFPCKRESRTDDVCCNSYYPLQRVRELITDYDKNFSTPSIMSIKKARQIYARQGGTSSIFVHDDELQLIPESDREERVRFYADHGIGLVARSKHDNSEGGFRLQPPRVIQEGEQHELRSGAQSRNGRDHSAA